MLLLRGSALPINTGKSAKRSNMCSLQVGSSQHGAISVLPTRARSYR